MLMLTLTQANLLIINFLQHKLFRLFWWIGEIKYQLNIKISTGYLSCRLQIGCIHRIFFFAV